MKKTDWWILLAASAAAAVLRVLQLRTGFDADDLPVSGNAFALLLPVVLAAATAYFAVTARKLPGLDREGAGRKLEESFSFSENMPALFCAVMGSFLIAASAFAAFAGYTRGLQLKPLSAAAVFAAVCYLYAVFSIKRRSGTPGLALLLPVIVLLVYLILLYRADASDPVLAHIYVEILAVSALALCSLETAAFAYGCGSPRVLVPSCAAAILCSVALAAEMKSVSSVLLFAGGAMLACGFLAALRLDQGAAAAENQH